MIFNVYMSELEVEEFRKYELTHKRPLEEIIPAAINQLYADKYDVTVTRRALGYDRPVKITVPLSKQLQERLQLLEQWFEVNRTTLVYTALERTAPPEYPGPFSKVEFWVTQPQANLLRNRAEAEKKSVDEYVAHCVAATHHRVVSYKRVEEVNELPPHRTVKVVIAIGAYPQYCLNDLCEIWMQKPTFAIFACLRDYVRNLPRQSAVDAPPS